RRYFISIPSGVLYHFFTLIFFFLCNYGFLERPNEDKVFDGKLFKIYSKAFSLRQESDYDVSYKLNAEKVKELLSETEEFIKEVKEYVLK
ncbi:MAG: hypothetical protein FWC57_05325, partial [Endomicrobia bacterium]|nr:hypothetical protein [Endomicrobiia bacterium]